MSSGVGTKIWDRLGSLSSLGRPPAAVAHDLLLGRAHHAALVVERGQLGAGGEEAAGLAGVDALGQGQQVDPRRLQPRQRFQQVDQVGAEGVGR